MKKVLIFIILLSASRLFAAGLSTAEYNYMNDIVGGRATGLGGAYTAISDDPSGAYYNPAGLVFAPENQISLSVNSYKNRTTNYEEVIGDNDYTQEASSFYPSFFGLIQTVGNFKVGFTFINLNNEILDQDSYFNDLTFADQYDATFTMNYNITSNTLLAGPSIATFITNQLTIGLSLYGMYTSREEISFQMTTYDVSDVTYYSVTDTYITEEIWGIKPVLGIQYMPTDKVALGLSGMMGFIFSHERDVVLFEKSFSAGQDLNATDDNGNSLTTNERANRSYNDSSVPSIVRFGVAYFPTDRLLITADLIAHIGDKNYQEEVENTINVAIGTEYYVFSTFPVRFGIFTNMANTPEIDENKSGQEAHVNLLGLSSSFSWQTRNSSVTLAGSYQSSEYFGVNPLGEGEAQVYGDNQVQKMNATIYQVALTGSAKY